ncbi:hypothetical protein L6452_08401 [Arctium lappa]|uniref:Uncharacterized protein n=1 Tax=Arctium lappa TaxID=4217 RepID=A0ACB9DHP1_ARCLA|nr:hypothetical protein L6452_08401 [Arctium lappa]
MEISWEEALDVDDSDLQSLPILRPCKQQRRRDETKSPTTTDLPLSQTLDSSQSPSQSDNSHPGNFNNECPDEAPPPSRVIPGPAGIVQAAKLLKTRDNGRFLGQEEPMATQEYIRRVVEDPEEDADFKCSPWISAMEFLSGDGMFNSVASAHLGDIKGYLKNGKLDQVVAVVKSCAPNALGDLMVVLKDPTGTVSGTIHHKVLTEGEFEKASFVGSVLVLHKVSVFSPSRSAYYLNITKRNMVKHKGYLLYDLDVHKFKESYVTSADLMMLIIHQQPLSQLPRMAKKHLHEPHGKILEPALGTKKCPFCVKVKWTAFSFVSLTPRRPMVVCRKPTLSTITSDFLAKGGTVALRTRALAPALVFVWSSRADNMPLYLEAGRRTSLEVSLKKPSFQGCVHYAAASSGLRSSIISTPTMKVYLNYQ